MWSSVVNFILTAASMVPFGPPPMPSVSDFHLSSACLRPAERREWGTLTKDERAEWIGAIKCLAGMPHNDSVFASQYPASLPSFNPNSSYFDDFVYTHMDFVRLVHQSGYFLPWHRYILHVLESAMKDHCGYKGATPYWDWTKDTSDFYNSPFFKDSDPHSGLGGWGNPAADIEVQGGAFATGFKLAYPTPHTLRRNYTLRPWINYQLTGPPFDEFKLANETFTTSTVANLVNGYIGDFRGFQTELDSAQGPHWGIHKILGGDMNGLCPRDSCQAAKAFAPNDPLFWLHHAHLDKIWSDWQNRRPENAGAFSGGSTWRYGTPEGRIKYPCGGPPDLSLADFLPSNGLFGDVTIEDVLNTTSGALCYVYI